MGIIGRHSFELCSRPRIISSASYVGDKEGKGPLRECFDKICRDDTLGLDSWEQAESRMFESAVRVALAKIKRQSDDLSCLLGGDLLNQIISSGFAAREIRAPFIGLYGACSTISEGLMLGGMLVDGGFAELAACAASSHFSAAERQFRYPLEMGVQAVPSSQRTVTGAGSIIIQAAGEFRPGAGNVFEHVALTGGTIGSLFISMQKGVSRGIFSNEAGLGTGSIAHACADTKKPVKQGMFGIFEVFADTIIICTLTAMVILCSGTPVNYGTAAGAELTISGFTTTYGGWASIFTAVALCCFAFSTIIGWGLYGSRFLVFLCHSDKVAKPFFVVYSFVSILGATVDLGLLWSIADTFNGLMSIPNLIALLLLSGTVVKLTKEFFASEG